MSGSVTGTIFKVSTWGESHGAAVGAVVDGCPSGIPLSEGDFVPDMARRRPGGGGLSTSRAEEDAVEILSGVFEGVTTGTPVSLLIRNADRRSGDYSEIADVYRPGHADYAYDKKYGFRDWRGGGRSSGRETAARVAAGVIAKKILCELGINVTARVVSIGGINADGGTATQLPDDGDSYGGLIECVISGVRAGFGEPVFDKLDALLAKAVMSVGAVKGVEIGAGFKAAEMKGSENNDGFYSENGKILKYTNNSGGILGGISDGSDIIIRCAVKPTPSIPLPQRTVGRDGNERVVEVKGRHDRSIVPRAVAVVEAMAAITLADRIMAGMASRIESIKKFYFTEM